MSTKKRINIKSDKVALMFSNWLAQLVALLKPRNLFLIIGWKDKRFFNGAIDGYGI